jgi:hypothetical protein
VARGQAAILDQAAQSPRNGRFENDVLRATNHESTVKGVPCSVPFSSAVIAPLQYGIAPERQKSYSSLREIKRIRDRGET